MPKLDATDRIATLEAKVEEQAAQLAAEKAARADADAKITTLELRDIRRESEHRSLLKTYDGLIADREKMRRDLEEDFTFLGKAFDDRMKELTARIASHGGGEGDPEGLYPVLSEFLKIIQEGMNLALDHERKLMQRWVLDLIEKVLQNQDRLADLVARTGE
jgi:hypothetical protein